MGRHISVRAHLEAGTSRKERDLTSREKLPSRENLGRARRSVAPIRPRHSAASAAEGRSLLLIRGIWRRIRGMWRYLVIPTEGRNLLSRRMKYGLRQVLSFRPKGGICFLTAIETAPTLVSSLSNRQRPSPLCPGLENREACSSQVPCWVQNNEQTWASALVTVDSQLVRRDGT